MRSYELILLFDPVLGDEKISGLGTKIEEKIKSLGGEIEKIDKWGVRRLGSPIQEPKKLSQVYYLLIVFKSATSLPAQILSYLKVTEDVIRYSLCLAVPPQETRPTVKSETPAKEIEAVHVGEIEGAAELGQS